MLDMYRNLLADVLYLPTYTSYENWINGFYTKVIIKILDLKL